MSPAEEGGSVLTATNVPICPPPHQLPRRGRTALAQDLQHIMCPIHPYLPFQEQVAVL